MRHSFSALLLVVVAAPAAAHLSILNRSLPAGTVQTVDFRLGHGCQGSPTTALRIEIPAGVSAVQAAAMAGWRIETEPGADGDLGRPRAITWKGGSLPSSEHGMFRVAMKLPEVPGRLVFPGLQTCEEGSQRWVDVAAQPGERRGEHPAAVLDVVVPTHVVPDGRS